MKVMRVNATATAAVCAVTNRHPSGRNWNHGSISRARAGSPTQPRAMLARVMPSWVAAIDRSRFSHLLDLGAADGDQGELGGHKEPVEGHQGRNREQAQNVPQPVAISRRRGRDNHESRSSEERDLAFRVAIPANGVPPRPTRGGPSLS
jgi:hypothetical protein